MSFDLTFNCIYGVFSLNKSWLRDLNALFLLEFDLTDTNNSANNASHHVLYPEKLTVRVV
jgi:hypothetical protein